MIELIAILTVSTFMTIVETIGYIEVLTIFWLIDNLFLVQG